MNVDRERGRGKYDGTAGDVTEEKDRGEKM